MKHVLPSMPNPTNIFLQPCMITLLTLSRKETAINCIKWSRSTGLLQSVHCSSQGEFLCCPCARESAQSFPDKLKIQSPGQMTPNSEKAGQHYTLLPQKYGNTNKNEVVCERAICEAGGSVMQSSSFPPSPTQRCAVRTIPHPAHQ